ncbi:MAG: hypothetical protein M3Y82_10525 [Verrucomicrobiota bacterium]|nr:hypothetical protein [Verrucomicrobiota bacterium]
MLDLSPYFRERFITAERTNLEMVSVAGRQIFDGLPFNVEGRVCLYGKALAHQRKQPASAFPDFMGIKLDRTFDELHLLHAAYFTESKNLDAISMLLSRSPCAVDSNCLSFFLKNLNRSKCHFSFRQGENGA